MENEKVQKDRFDELFQNPGSYYRGAPFWAWNTKLDRDRLKRQIGYFREMGMGGFHMHSRTGLDTPYMEEEFLSMVEFCVQEAKRNGMYAYLYDEDRWPSGAAGGKVTKNPAYRSRYLAVTPIPDEKREAQEADYISSARAKVHSGGTLVAAYRLFWKDGLLDGYERLDIHGKLPEDCWYVYLELAEESPWYNNQTYVDTLNPEAIREFIRQTHEKYCALLKEDFGGCVPSIFTDEPQFPHKTQAGRAGERTDVILPYTESFEDRYREKYGESFFARLPEVLWEMPGELVSGTRDLADRPYDVRAHAGEPDLGAGRGHAFLSELSDAGHRYALRSAGIHDGQAGPERGASVRKGGRPERAVRCDELGFRFQEA